VATHLGGRLARYGPPSGIDLILPMPLHPRRLRERGFNQAVELARPLARAWGLPLDIALAGRTVDTAPQVSLPWTARRGNMREAFSCHGTLAGRSILVIDDVMTTGATLDALAHVLRKHGAARVCNLVVARTLAPD
jgi:ComF family protein